MNPRNNEQTLRQKTVEGIKNYLKYHKLNPGDRLPPENIGRSWCFGN
jgi:DNA-binding FadR family transcriptional regulator